MFSGGETEINYQKTDLVHKFHPTQMRLTHPSTFTPIPVLFCLAWCMMGNVRESKWMIGKNCLNSINEISLSMSMRQGIETQDIDQFGILFI